MRSLYVRIWLTVVAALALFAAVSGWLVQRHLNQERARLENVVQERAAAWGELLQRSLPAADRPPEEQAAGLRDWSQRLRVPLALEDATGRRIAASESYLRRERQQGQRARPTLAIELDDGRVLRVMPRPRRYRMPGLHAAPDDGDVAPDGDESPPRSRGGRLDLPGVPDGVLLLVLLAVLFAAVAAGAWPVVRRLTRRLEALQQGVEAFGAGALERRVAEDGHDEVATLARSFNRAAAQIEALLRSHRNLLANASHELRSPLARLKMALEMLDEAPQDRREGLRAEIRANIAELDAQVEEVLLASRLDAQRDAAAPQREPVDLLALAAEEGARFGVEVHGEVAVVVGEERLLRRALRNLLENARRYGGSGIEIEVRALVGRASVVVSDQGPGVPRAYREAIFEPYFRLPGHAEREGGVGLGLSLVRQIVERHGGSVRCEPRTGGGTVFVVDLPER